MNFNEFGLTINGYTFEGIWEDVKIAKSMSALGGQIQVRTVDFFPETHELWNISKGDKYIATINALPISIGFIEEVEINYNANGGSISFSGRETVADLSDCSFDGTERHWTDVTVANIIYYITEPFTIPVTIDPAVAFRSGTIYPEIVLEEGKNCAEIIYELCRANNILPVSMGDGYLTLTQTTNVMFAADLLGRQNILEASFVDSDTNRFSKYTIKGTGVESPTISTPAEYLSSSGSYEDPQIVRHRPKTILSEYANDAGKCVAQSWFEANLRAGLSKRVTYRLEGWTEVVGKIPWNINKLVHIFDEKFQLNRNMLINTVYFEYNGSSGFTTTLGLVDPITYTLNPGMYSIRTTFDSREISLL